MQKGINFKKNMGPKKYISISNIWRLFHGKCAQMGLISLVKKINKWVSAVS